MSSFKHHESCPKCGSKDNLGVWTDGHKFCFGCKYYVPPPDSINNMRTKIMENNNNEFSLLDTSTFTAIIPISALEWLGTYVITKEEIRRYSICWNTKTDSLVFPVFNTNKEVVFTNERYFGPRTDYPKYRAYGKKFKHFLFALYLG